MFQKMVTLSSLVLVKALLILLISTRTTSTTTVDAMATEIEMLFSACKTNDADMLRVRLEQSKVDINVVGPGGQTPLMFSVLQGFDISVGVLLEAGADVTIGEMDGYTPIHGAGFQGRPKIAKMLIDHGVDPLDVHSDGYNAMHRACWGREKRHAATVKIFIENGVPYNVQSKTGQTCMDESKNPYTMSILKEYVFAEKNVDDISIDEEEKGQKEPIDENTVDHSEL